MSSIEDHQRRVDTPPPTDEICDNIISDPPPPYPSRTRRSRTNTVRSSRAQQLHQQNGHRIQTSHTLIASSDSHSDDGYAFPRTPGPNTEDDDVGMLDEQGGTSTDTSRRHDKSCFSGASLRRYFRPMWEAAYYRALFHLLFVNFPYALLAWVYLFVFTVTGTTLLIALPLGAILCFLDLLGARTFARGELNLQTRFHSPLSYPPPYPSRPIFSRYREPTNEEIEAGLLAPTRNGLVKERSFYKNAYAMFTDPTSYQALFYFIVIKPAITLILTLTILIFVLPAITLILPAPAALRAVRKLGTWQANIAVEGLYHAVR